MQEFLKILIYTSFVLNILCGAWVLVGIVQWVTGMRQK